MQKCRAESKVCKIVEENQRYLISPMVKHELIRQYANEVSNTRIQEHQKGKKNS